MIFLCCMPSVKSILKSVTSCNFCLHYCYAGKPDVILTKFSAMTISFIDYEVFIDNRRPTIIMDGGGWTDKGRHHHVLTHTYMVFPIIKLRICLSSPVYLFSTISSYFALYIPTNINQFRFGFLKIMVLPHPFESWAGPLPYRASLAMS